MTTPVTVTEGSETLVIEGDKHLSRFTSSSAGEEVTLNTPVSYALGSGSVAFSFASDNPTEVAIDAGGNVATSVVAGNAASANITITATQGETVTVRSAFVSLSALGETVVDVITGGVDGSARKEMTEAIDLALIGADVSTQQDVYTTQNHTSGAYVRNESFFLSSHAHSLTCASPWNSSGGNKKAGTAVTKRHAVLNSHYPIPVGTIVRFIPSESPFTPVDREVVQARGIFNSAVSPDTDAWVVLFDADLPDSITPCKIFPSNYETYLPAGSYVSSYPATKIPLLALDQEEKGLIFEVHNIYTTLNGKPKASWRTPTDPLRSPFSEDIISGDSGNPIFAVAGSELWLLSTFWWPDFGPSYGSLVPELNAMIVTLDTLQGDLTGYTITEGDLSSYPTY